MASKTRGFEFAYNLDGTNNGPTIRDLPVSANTLRPGDLVVLTSGQLAACAANVAEVTGVMYESAAGAQAGDLRKCAIIQPGQVWRCSSDASSQAGNLGVSTINIVDANTIDATPATGGSLILVAKGDLDSDGNQITYVSFSNVTFA
jgi:hypothetical protein